MPRRPVATVEPDRAGDRTDDRSASRQALGQALIGRAEQVAERAAERAFPGLDVDRGYFSNSALATRLIGRWLLTGEVASAEEHDTLAKDADNPLAGEYGLAHLTKSYLAWRDSLCDVIREEAAVLKVGVEVTTAALTAVRVSCDSSLVRMGKRYDATRRRLESLVNDERARLIHAALHDRLTGLPNRVQFIDIVGETLVDAEAASARAFSSSTWTTSSGSTTASGTGWGTSWSWPSADASPMSPVIATWWLASGATSS